MFVRSGNSFEAAACKKKNLNFSLLSVPSLSSLDHIQNKQRAGLGKSNQGGPRDLCRPHSLPFCGHQTFTYTHTRPQQKKSQNNEKIDGGEGWVPEHFTEQKKSVLDQRETCVHAAFFSCFFLPVADFIFSFQWYG